MALLGADELALLRADMESVLDDTCTVARRTRVDDDAGSWTYTTTTSAVDCRLGPVSGRERLAGGQTVSEADAVVTLAHDADIQSNDTITHDGTTYEVVDIANRSDRLVRRVMVRRTG